MPISWQAQGLNFTKGICSNHISTVSMQFFVESTAVSAHSNSSTSGLLPSTRWDAYTMAIAGSAIIGVGLIAYSLMGSASAPGVQANTVQTAPAQAATPARSAQGMVQAAAKPVDSKTITEPSAAELAKKDSAFDKFYVPPAGCSTPPKANENPDCGVRYGHARMEFERQWALGQVR
jgi:hypothetical protein